MYCDDFRRFSWRQDPRGGVWRTPRIDDAADLGFWWPAGALGAPLTHGHGPGSNGRRFWPWMPGEINFEAAHVGRTVGGLRLVEAGEGEM